MNAEAAILPAFILLAAAFVGGMLVATQDTHCILPGTIREVEVNGVTWRGTACDTMPGVCIRDAKPVKGGR